MPAPKKFEPRMCNQVREAAKLGATDVQMAKILGVSRSTLSEWKKDYPEFIEAMTEGKAEADAEVQKSLFQRATGYRHIAFKLFHDSKTGKVVTKRYVEHYPPDTMAIMYWLNNRRPDLWRHISRMEHVGKDGGPIQTEHFSDIEAARRIGFALALAAKTIEKAKEPT